MEKARKNAAKSLRSAKILSVFSGSSSASQLCAAPATDARQCDAPNSPVVTKTTSPHSLTASDSPNQQTINVDVQKLTQEMERARLQNELIQKENEILRALLASESVKPAKCFRRAIILRLYPEEVLNAIGVHEKHDSIFVAVEATLFSSKNVPIQKISTSFSDRHWQEEMKFILDTESRWIDGKFIFELRQKLFIAGDDPVIATASLSLHQCLNWLQEGGEHSLQIEMKRTTAFTEGNTRTVLCVSVKVAAERISSEPAINIEANLQPPFEPSILEKTSDAHDICIQNDIPPMDAVSVDAVLGSTNESAFVSAVEDFNNTGSRKETMSHTNTGGEPPAVSQNQEQKFKTITNRIKLTSIFKKSTVQTASDGLAESIAGASSSEDEDGITQKNLDDLITSKSSWRLELARNSSRSVSAEFLDSRAAHLSMSSMIHHQKAIASKSSLIPVLSSSAKSSQTKILQALNSEISGLSFESFQDTTSTKIKTPDLDVGIFIPQIAFNSTTEDIPEQAQETAPLETNKDTNLVAAIKGVSFSNQRLLAIIKKNRESKSRSVADSVNATAIENIDSPEITNNSVQPESAKPMTSSLESSESVDGNSTTGCWSEQGPARAFKLRIVAVWRILTGLFCRLRVRQRNGTVQPVSENLDVESEVQMMKIAEARRIHILNSKSAAKRLMEEFNSMTDSEGIVLTTSTHQDEDVITSRLIAAVASLKEAFFELPYRAVKITPVSAIVQVMKQLPAGNSSAHQRLTAIQVFLQSKWIDCESMVQIMSWIKSPSEEVKFFEFSSMRVTDKQGLAMIASRFIHTKGTKFVALKTIERLLALSHKNVNARNQYRATKDAICSLEDEGDP